MPRRIRLEPDTDLYLHQRSRHGIEGCAKNLNRAVRFG
jgi:hypothetical protein